MNSKNETLPAPSMDRPLTPAYKRKIFIKRLTLPVAICGLILGGVNWGFSTIRPSVKRRLIRTAVVERGEVRETIMASGTVVPTFEEVLTCPIRTTVLKVLREPGDFLQPGDRLLVLDTHETRRSLSKLDERIQVKRNRQAKIQVDLEVELNHLRGESADRHLRGRF